MRLHRPPSATDDERPRNRTLAFGEGLVVVALLGLLDALWGERHVVIATVLLGPFIASFAATPRQTAVVGAVASLVALASGTWNDNFDQWEFYVRLAAVVAGGGFAVLGAQARTRQAQIRRRFGLLADIADVADGTYTLDQTADRLNELIVPELADIAVLDVIRDGRLHRLSVRASGRDASELERRIGADEPPSAPAEQAHLIQAPRSDAEPLRTAGVRSLIVVPLRARGRSLGALTLAVTQASGRGYDDEDLEFAEVLSGRAALALDNAGMFAELETMEAQLTAALGSLADAVTVQTREGRLIYVNDAAADALGFSTARELLATPTEAIVDRFDSYHEDGSPLRVEELPGRRVLAGESPEPLVVRAINRETGEERWRVVKATAVNDREGRPRLAVNVVEDVTEVKRAELTQRLLAQAGDVLSSSLDYEQTLQEVARLAVPELADWCAVTLPDERGFLRTVAVAHVDEEKVRFARSISERYPGHVHDEAGAAQVIREGASQVINDITEEMLRAGAVDDEHYELLQRLGMRAAMVVPLSVAGTTIGTLALVTAESGRSFTEADRLLAEELGRRAGIAVENARLYTERSTIAETLQAGLLPQALPPMPGWGTAALYHPAGAENLVGGDFYDAFALRHGWAVVVGDVAGRGAAAAALTALARYTLRAVAQMTDQPLAALDRLNHALYERGDLALCTAACATLQETPDGSEATVVCAGHPLPILLRDGRPEAVGRFGSMIGAYERGNWEPVTVPMAAGDVLVLYTDGVIDTVGAPGRFGEDRLRATLEGARTAEDAIGRIAAALEEFQLRAQPDDRAVVAIERLGVTAAAAGDGEASTTAA